MSRLEEIDIQLNYIQKVRNMLPSDNLLKILAKQEKQLLEEKIVIAEKE